LDVGKRSVQTENIGEMEEHDTNTFQSQTRRNGTREPEKEGKGGRASRGQKTTKKGRPKKRPERGQEIKKV